MGLILIVFLNSYYIYTTIDHCQNSLNEIDLVILLLLVFLLFI